MTHLHRNPGLTDDGSPDLGASIGVPAIVSCSTMRRLLAQVERVAKTDATVLITGESGCGKELIARAVHHYSPRRSKALIDINCAALPDSLLETELLGYEKGAFSGADSEKPGLYELADHGTLLLDEIGELDNRIQAKLLRILDGVPYYRIGGVEKVSSDVRLIALTNCDLRTALRDGRFRSDLYHRLCQVPLLVPPLRERVEDILPIAEFYLARENPGLRFSARAVKALKTYSWPGNVRELRNVVVRAAVLADASAVVDLPEEFQSQTPSHDLHPMFALPRLKRDAILTALQEMRGSQQEVATRLGISKRTLQRRITAYRLPTSRSNAAAVMARLESKA